MSLLENINGQLRSDRLESFLNVDVVLRDVALDIVTVKTLDYGGYW